MRKLSVILLLCALIPSLCGCIFTDEVLDSLPAYQGKVMYTEGVFQDYTDYAIYTYGDIDESTLTASTYFQKISAEDIENILTYINNFEKCVEVYRSGDDSSELATHYAFDETIIGEGDYFHIKTKEGTPIGNSTYGKFDNYSLYFFDTDTNTLYYFHTNI